MSRVEDRGDGGVGCCWKSLLFGERSRSRRDGGLFDGI